MFQSPLVYQYFHEQRERGRHLIRFRQVNSGGDDADFWEFIYYIFVYFIFHISYFMLHLTYYRVHSIYSKAHATYCILGSHKYYYYCCWYYYFYYIVHSIYCKVHATYLSNTYYILHQYSIAHKTLRRTLQLDGSMKHPVICNIGM